MLRHLEPHHPLSGLATSASHPLTLLDVLTILIELAHAKQKSETPDRSRLLVKLRANAKRPFTLKMEAYLDHPYGRRNVSGLGALLRVN